MTNVSQPMTIFFLLRTQPAWLALSRAERKTIADQAFADCRTACPGFSFRYFDAEAFTTACTDLMMIEAINPLDYSFAIEALRDSPLFSAPYFEAVSIIPTIENGYAAYERSIEGA